MEHVLHIFGGGCGEHIIWTWVLPASGVGIHAVRQWFKVDRQ